MADSVGTALLWLAAVGLLCHGAWELGRDHTAARRLNCTFLVGLREAVRRALGAADATSEGAHAVAFARPLQASRPRR